MLNETRIKVLELIADIVNNIHWGGLAIDGNNERSLTMVNKQHNSTVVNLQVPQTIVELRKLKPATEWEFPRTKLKDAEQWLREIQALIIHSQNNRPALLTFSVFNKFYRGRLESLFCDVLTKMNIDDLDSLTKTTEELAKIDKDQDLFTWRIPAVDISTYK